MMMTNWITTTIKQLICRHDFKRIGDRLVKVNAHYIVPKTAYKCKHCGKVIYK